MPVGGMISDTIVDEVSRKADIVHIVSSYVTLEQKGNQFWGLCPFHNEKTPSFSVNRDSNLFYCFGCQKGGGIFQFLMDIEGLSFPEAVRKVAEDVGVAIRESSQGREPQNNRKTLQELYVRVSGTFRWLLLNRPEASHARQYLKSRGISDDTSANFQLGWAHSDGEWLYRFLLGKRYSPKFLAESGLFSRKSPHWCLFVDRLMFPVMTDTKRVVAFSGRQLSDRGPKYINSPDTIIYRKSSELYGLGQAKKHIRESREVYLCEGNIDVASCYQAGFPQTVAPLGTSFTSAQSRLLKRFCGTIIMAFDGDEAGKAACMKASVLAEQTGFSVKAVNIPEKSDPGDILINLGAPVLKKILSEPLKFFDFVLKYNTLGVSGASGDAQENFLKELKPYLNAVDSDIRRDAYLKQLAEVLDINPAAIFPEYHRRFYKSPQSSKVNAVKKVVFNSIELQLMSAVAVKTELFSLLRTLLAPEMLKDGRALSIYRIMDEMHLQGRVLQTDLIIEQIEENNIKNFIITNASRGLFDEKSEETIKDKIRLIRLRNLNEERQELISKLTDSQEYRGRLLPRIQEISRVIEELNMQAKP